MGKQIKIFIAETRLLTLRHSSDCSHGIARTQNRSNETNGAYYCAKNSVIIGEKSNGTALFRKFYSKILVYLISCNGTRSQKIGHHFIISPFSSLLRVRVIKVTSALIENRKTVWK